MIEWTKDNKEKKRVEIENTFSRTTSHKNIWIPHKFRTLDLDSHKFTKKFVFKVWDALYRKEKWVYNSPLISLTGTNFFIPEKEIFFRAEIRNQQIKDICTKGKIKPAQELEVLYGWKLSEWELFQLNHLLNKLPHPIRDGKELNQLEKLCATQTPLKKGISKIYAILSDLEGQGRPSYIVGK